MDPTLLVLLIAAGGFVAWKAGFFNFQAGGDIGDVYIPPSQTFSGAGANQEEDQALNAGANAVSTGLQYIPVVGKALASAFTSIYNSIMAGHIQRTKEAKDENSSLTAAVPQWDKDIKTIVQGYNSGGLSAAQVVQLFGVARANYWAITGPHIQPGRNGCQTGSIPKDVADKQFPGMKQCTGDWGAACCVCYADLDNSFNNMKAALAITEKSGKAATANILAVFPSKYGGISRPAYTVTFKKNVSVFSH
jgi:hypothetical protein